MKTSFARQRGKHTSSKTSSNFRNERSGQMDRSLLFTQIVYANRICSFIGRDGPTEVLQLMRLNHTFHEAISLYCHEMWSALARRVEAETTNGNVVSSPSARWFTSFFDKIAKADPVFITSPAVLWMLSKLLQSGDLSPNLRVRATMPNQHPPGSETIPLLCALALKASADRVIDLLLQSRHIDVDAEAGRNRRPLYLAARDGCLDNVRALLAHPPTAAAQVNARTRASWTPLSAAAFYNHAEICEMLLLAGADWRVPNVQGSRALDLAIHLSNAKVAVALVKHGDDMTELTEGRSAGSLVPIASAMANSAPVARAMLDAAVEARLDIGPRLDAVKIGTLSLLCFAACSESDEDFVTSLLKLGCNPNVTSDGNVGSTKQWTPLTFAFVRSKPQRALALMKDPRCKTIEDDSVVEQVSKIFDEAKLRAFVQAAKDAGRHEFADYLNVRVAFVVTMNETAKKKNGAQS